MAKTHPYDVGDKVLLHLDTRSERATVTGIGWEHSRPKIMVKMDADAEHGDPRVRASVYKWDVRAGHALGRFGPVSAVDLLGEIADA